MTPEAQRIAIAEACGWKIAGLPINPKNKTIKGWPKYGSIVRNVPDYLSDLNAMNEAEKVLNPPPFDREQDRYDDDPKWREYSRQLATICPMGTYIRATAAQRSEAFLKTLNLWVNDNHEASGGKNKNEGHTDK